MGLTKRETKRNVRKNGAEAFTNCRRDSGIGSSRRRSDGGVVGPRFCRLMGDVAAVSHGRYLSGLLLGIGLAFWTCVAKIETQGARFSVLAGTVFLGGCARLLGSLAGGDLPNAQIVFALTMEMLVTPGLWLWRRRVGNYAK